MSESERGVKASKGTSERESKCLCVLCCVCF